MRYLRFLSLIFIFLTIILPAISRAQNVVFVKYDKSVAPLVAKSRLQSTLERLSRTESSFSMDQVKIVPFAKGLGETIPELEGIMAIKTGKPETASFLLGSLQREENIEYVQIGARYQTDNVPNDSLVSTQWALSKIGAFEAWKITEGSDTVLVAIIDTGIDYLHPDLTNKIYKNPGETGFDEFGRDKRFNGIDDDNNGFIDDYQGWDFTDRTGFPFDTTGGDYLDWDNDPMDQNLFSHGTAVAGIIAAETNNGMGVAGVAPGIKVLNLRAFDPQGYGEEDDVAAAILYSVKMGAKVINMSFGDNSYSHVLRDVVRYAYSKNIVMVASSGNSNSSNPHYPSGYSEVISVGNTTQEDYVAGTSNYGSTLDMVAPGTLIKTTTRNWTYSDFSGTSAAAPFVSAAAALILSKQGFTNDEVRQILKSTADDIGNPGWDLRSGAGRLNLERALKVLAPSVVKFNSPKQDFSTDKDTLKINATILSAYFQSFSLEYGKELNPTAWTSLLTDVKNQVSESEIYQLSLISLPDTVYTLRLIVKQTNSFVSEERVNFRIKRAATQGELISLIPAYYGDKPTFLAAFYTKDPAVVRMHYKKSYEDSYKYVTLDGFSTNNGFVKQLHYGFVPKSQMSPSETYFIYFEIINESGFSNPVFDSLGVPFTINSGDLFRTWEKKEKPYTLPAGYIFDKTITLPGNNKGVLLREVMTAKEMDIFRFENNSFTKLSGDTLSNKIPKDYGDFNNDGVNELLSLWGYSAHFLKQTNGEKTFSLVTSADTSFFWPIGVFDLDRDGKNELLAIKNDTTIVIYGINNDLSLTYKSQFTNPSGPGFGGNIFNAPFVVVKDIDNDGKNEIVFTDSDGDIVIMKVNSITDIKPDKIVRTGYLSSSSYLAVGDFNNDGKSDIAVLLQAVPEADIAPYNRLIIFNFIGNDLNVSYDNAFIDPAVEFRSTFQNASNALKFFDVDNDGKEELLMFTYPYAYIIKNQGIGGEVVSYDENVNTNAILIDDFDANGIPDIAYPYGSIIKFYEFNQTRSFAPSLVSAFSTENNSVIINFAGTSQKYYIYRGTTDTNLELYDSTNTQSYSDNNVALNNYYWYKIEGVSLSYKASTKAFKVYHHVPAKYSGARAESHNSVTVNFTNKMRKEIDNPSGIFLVKDGRKVQLSSYTPSGENSFHLSFLEDFEQGQNRVILTGLTDNYGSPTPADTAYFNYTPEVVQQQFYIERFEILDIYTISVSFNLEPDPASVANLDNYKFSPDNRVTAATVSGSDAKTVILSLKGAKPVGAFGREYTLNIVNLRSSAATGGVEIAKNAGATIVLTASAKDLEDMFVYPSPADRSKHRILTFANIPRFVNIVIFNLSGVKIMELYESDGNGGVDWDMRDFDGKDVPTGVYIYRASMTDEKKNEIASKIGKFVVVN